MTLTTHAVIGAVIGGATGNPQLAFWLSFVSHFLVDIIPHGDRDMYEGHKSKTAQKRALAYVTTDAAVAVIVVALMLALSPERTLTFAIAAGIIGSVLPDVITGYYELFEPRWLTWFHKMHFFFHNLVSDRTGDIPLRYGLAGQLAFIAAAQYLF